MKLHIITTGAPPLIDGIGDYTATMAATLRRMDPSIDISLFVPDTDTRYTPIDGVSIRPLYRTEDIGSFHRLAPIFRDEKPDWVLLQYEGFSYGRWGRNPILPHVLRTARQTIPNLRMAVMIHEPFVRISTQLSAANLKNMVYATWQRQRFRDVIRTSDAVFFSTERWANEFRPWFPDKTLHHLVIGSSIPFHPLPGGIAEAKERLGIAQDPIVLGMFGTAHPSRLTAPLGQTLQRIKAAGQKPFYLYIGPHPAAFREHVPADIPSLIEGPFPATEVSHRLQAVDICLSPYIDGLSARRSAFLAGLEHGLPTLGTTGISTDTLLLNQLGKAFHAVPVDENDPRGEKIDATFTERFSAAACELATDPQSRIRLGVEAKRFYTNTFAWEQIAHYMLDIFAKAR